MLIQQAYRYELKPNNKQRTLLVKHAGCARFAYNWALARRIEEYKKEGTSNNAIKQHRQLNALKKTEFPWMYEVSKCAPQEALRDLQRAYENFFRRLKAGENPGFPKFKKKGRNDSFRLTGAIYVYPKHIQLPRLGKIRSKEETKVKGKLLSATVRQIATRWFVSLSVDCEVVEPRPFYCEETLPSKKGRGEPKEIKGEVVGIDRGLEKFACVSDGSIFYAPKPLKKLFKKLQRLSRSHSHKVKGSSNRRKSAIKLGRLHYRISNIRKDSIHKLSTELAKTKQVLCVESLNTKGMMQNRHLARIISDVAWGELVRQLEYKCLWYGSHLVKAQPKFPSTRMCSRCGHINPSLLLSQRTFQCEECQMECDRDINAAKNLERYALITVSSTGIDACGEAVQQGSSVKQEENAVYPGGING
ncbi:MAG: RNA-guided endonuclease TnpB family protein [Candidatus Omnitrophota bacterium]